jgi:hypothetical protein
MKDSTQPRSKQRFAAMPLEFYGISTCISVAWLSDVSKQSGVSTMEILVLLGVVVVWIALQMWILPRFGIST